MKTIKPKTSKKLIHDITTAEHDPLSLAKAHGLEPEQLARWANDPAIRQTLHGLCLLADFQTQLLMSRYRAVAASRLIKIASDPDEQHAELARKACVDLLNTELSRTDSPSAIDAGEPAPLDPVRVREAFYGKPASGATTPSDSDSRMGNLI